LRFHDGEPRGAISLKHAAEEAGLGRLGKNTLLIHREKGNVMRLGGLMTALEWPPDFTGQIKDPCPDGCRKCEMACPVQALKDGSIDKTACLGRCIKHTLLPPAMMLPLVKRIVGSSRMLTRFMELFSLNFFELYGIGCIACLKACPYFPARKGGKVQ
jgi:epoxyqueuosine reductase QueG